MGVLGPDRDPPPHPPTPLPREASGALGPHRPNLCVLRRARGTGPNAHRPPGGPGWAPSQQLPLVPPLHGGHRPPECPTRLATQPGALATRPTLQLPRAGLGPAEPLACRRHGPPAQTSLPCHPPRQEGTVQGSRESAKRFLLMAVLHQECQPALPPPPTKSSPSALRQGKKNKALPRTKTRKENPKQPPKRSMATEAGQEEPAPQPGHLEGCLGRVRLKGQHSTLQGPLRAGSSPAAAVVTRNQWLLTEASPAADPNLSGATPPVPWVNLRPREGRRHGARHPQPGSERLILSGVVDATHQEAGLTATPQAAPRGTGNSVAARHALPLPWPRPPHRRCTLYVLPHQPWPRSQVLAGVAETPPPTPTPTPVW